MKYKHPCFECGKIVKWTDEAEQVYCPICNRHLFTRVDRLPHNGIYGDKMLDLINKE